MIYLSAYTQLAAHAFSNTSFSPERRGADTLSAFDQRLTDAVDQLKLAGVSADTVEKYIEQYKGMVSRYLGCETRCASSMITGPANFPVHQQQKRHQSARTASDDLDKFATMAVDRITNYAVRQQKLAQGITPLVEAQRNLNNRSKHQELMRKTNAALRACKAPTEREAALLELGWQPDVIKVLLNPRFGKKIGFQTWELTNNNAQIKRLQGRVAELKDREAKADAQNGEAQQFSFEGGYVELDYSTDRLRVVHDVKPDPITITKLKASGFKWSPRNSAWQRQLTDNARHAAQQLLGYSIFSQPILQD